MTQLQFDKYKEMSLIIAKDKKAEHKEELFSLFLEKYLSFDFEKIDDLDNYCFIVMKNMNIQLAKSKKNPPVELSYDVLNDISSQSIDYDYEEDSNLSYEEEVKLDVIEDVKKTLKNGELQLFILHFEKGISQNYIANKSGICKSTINNKINRIKKQINNEYKERMRKL